MSGRTYTGLKTVASVVAEALQVASCKWLVMLISGPSVLQRPAIAHHRTLDAIYLSNSAPSKHASAAASFLIPFNCIDRNRSTGINTSVILLAIIVLPLATTFLPAIQSTVPPACAVLLSITRRMCGGAMCDS